MRRTPRPVPRVSRSLAVEPHYDQSRQGAQPCGGASPPAKGAVCEARACRAAHQRHAETRSGAELPCLPSLPSRERAKTAAATRKLRWRENPRSRFTSLVRKLPQTALVRKPPSLFTSVRSPVIARARAAKTAADCTRAKTPFAFYFPPCEASSREHAPRKLPQTALVHARLHSARPVIARARAALPRPCCAAGPGSRAGGGAPRCPSPASSP